MKITFVAKGSEQLPISLLAAIARSEGHTIGIAFSTSLFQAEIPSLGRLLDDRSEVIQAIKDQKPDVLAFSAITLNYQWSLDIAREAKELFPDVKVIFGGVHTSAVPDRVLNNPQVDYVVVGEGDFAFSKILNAIAKGRPDGPISNARFKTEDGRIIRGMQAGFVPDLDLVPAFDKTIWEDYVNIGERYITMASRGCPYRCSFCFNNFFAKLPDEKKKGKYVRMRSVDHMINELVFAKKRYNLKFVDFFDDVFTVYKPWVKDFMIEYKKKVDVPFGFFSHPHYMDDEVMGWLKEGGAEWAQMGIQSMDEDFKYKSLHRYEDSKEIEQALESSHKHGIKIKVDHMFGLPGEPAGAQEKALVLYTKHSPVRINTYWTCFLPGTELMQQGLDQGIITQQQADDINDGLVSYSFGNKEGVRDKATSRYFGAYETLFKVFPLLPQVVRKRIKAKYLESLPSSVFRPIVIALDLFSCFITNNPDYIWQFNYYGLHLRNILLKKLGLKPMKLNTVNYSAVPDFDKIVTEEPETHIAKTELSAKAV